MAAALLWLVSLLVAGSWMACGYSRLGLFRAWKSPVPAGGSRPPVAVFAQRKPSKFISAELLTSLQTEDEEGDDEAASPGSLQQSTTKAQRKPSNARKKAKAEQARSTDKEADASHASGGGRMTDAASSSSSKEPASEDPSSSLHVENEARRKPSLRVRLVESAQPGFVRIGLSHVQVGFGAQEVLKNVTFSVTTGERVGLVGPNGAGKSTALKVLAGLVEPDEGVVEMSKPLLRISFLCQDFMDMLNDNNTLEEEVMSAFQEERAVLQEMQSCEQKMEAAIEQGASDVEHWVDEMRRLQDQARLLGAFSLESKVYKVLDRMGFAERDRAIRVKDFSGGWRMRIGLAKILASDPNILLLDEATNHMDLDSVSWLEAFLRMQSLPMVVVSHDREFLEQVCTKMVELEDGRAISYEHAGYSLFLQLRSDRLRFWRDRHAKQEQHLQEEQRWLRKNREDPAMAQAVRQRELAYQRFLSGPQYVAPPPREKKFYLHFPQPGRRCPETAVRAVDAMHGYGSVPLFSQVNWEVNRGDRVVLLGGNGVGKTTLLRLVLGLESPRGGVVDCAPSTQIGYYAQDQADALDGKLTVYQSVQEVAAGDLGPTELRSLLGQFLFQGDAVHKPVSCLSGGERARLAICRLLLQPANLLVLDEPTNHLDMTSREVLEAALRSFPGAIILVSHDRYFLSQVANKVCVLEGGKLHQYNGDYRHYLDHHQELGERVDARCEVGDPQYRIDKAKPSLAAERESARSKNFGGSGLHSGNPAKGVKNAKRFKEL